MQFDVSDEAANPVPGVLRDLGLDRSGVICVQREDAALTGPAAGGRGPRRAAARDRAGMPVWEMTACRACWEEPGIVTQIGSEDGEPGGA